MANKRNSLAVTVELTAKETRHRCHRETRSDHAIVVLVLAAVAGGVSCSDDGSPVPTAPRNELWPGLSISEPVAPASGGLTATAEGLVYVSASPATFGDGVSVTVTDLANDSSTTTSVEDGGFDPITVPGASGDELAIALRNSDGTARELRRRVPEQRPPRVVRNSPPTETSEVALTSRVLVVFSEPLDRSTIKSETIELSVDGKPVEGTLTLGADGLRAELTPATDLSAETRYTLIIATGIHDLSGDPLEGQVVATFSTGALANPFAQVSADGTHACAITRAGRAYCWGRNSSGQLGTESTTEMCFVGSCSSTPLPVSSGHNSEWVSVSAGSGHTCGVATSGAAYCWGANRYGELGVGSTIDQQRPAPISGFAFSTISAGSRHTCGVTPEGDAYCWGLDWQGSLGVGGATAETCADASGMEWPCSMRPLLVRGGLTFTSISAGSWHTCGVTTGGVAYCWGDNEDGALGIGTFDNSAPHPLPLRVSRGLTFVSIDASGRHTCGITSGGETYCWGEDRTGSLGNGSGATAGTSAAPSRVVGGHTFTSVDAGPNHTCGITASGEAYCWGQGAGGVLGDGSSDAHIVRAPAPVLGGLTFMSISVGFQTCGLTAVGQAYCWGSNRYGALGDGSYEGKPVPVPVRQP